ncbi:MAG: hypothetical protein K2X81_01555, partial [Candidatus Obscuribacterales bacterium]|nr:hypothetical protein [Candidatus Obscuribacterales bacterium]
MNSNGFPQRKSGVVLSLCLLLTCQTFYIQAFALPDADAGAGANKDASGSKDASSSTDAGASKSSGSDSIFSGGQSWAIVPAGSPSAPPRPRAHNDGFAQPRYQGTVQTTQLNGFQSRFPQSGFGAKSPAMQSSNASANSASAAPPPLKLFGRIEELATGKGARIPLKMVAMTPIRDASLDAPPPKLASNAKAFNLSGQIATTQKTQTPTQTLTSMVSKSPPPSFPTDYRGTFSGDLTIQQVNFDPTYFEFDKAEATKQAKIITVGRQGRCSATFYQGNSGKIELKPTNVTFSVMLNAAEEIKDMGDSPLTALLGGANGGASSLLGNMQIPVPIVLPLGNLPSGGRGVTGNEMGSELMKNNLKELAKGVLEQQVVTKDTDKNKNGQVRTTYTESVLRFTKVNEDRLYLQAASVSYNDEGQYQNKVLMSGMLDRGAGGGGGDTPATVNVNPLGGLFGGAGMGDGGQGTDPSSMGGAANPLGG